MKNDTHCPSNAIGGKTFQRRISLVLVTSSIHSRTSGLAVPGVGYRMVRVSGNELALPIPLAVILAPDANHGQLIIPTLVSLNEAYMTCVPSAELQIASGALNISSVLQLSVIFCLFCFCYFCVLFLFICYFVILINAVAIGNDARTE